MNHLPGKNPACTPRPTSGGTTVRQNVTPSAPPQGGGAPGTGSAKK